MKNETNGSGNTGRACTRGSPPTDLEVRAGDTASNLSEELRHDFDKLHRLHDVQNLLQLVEEHDLLWTVHLRPVFEEASHHLEGEMSERGREGGREGGKASS